MKAVKASKPPTSVGLYAHSHRQLPTNEVCRMEALVSEPRMHQTPDDSDVIAWLSLPDTQSINALQQMIDPLNTNQKDTVRHRIAIRNQLIGRVANAKTIINECRSDNKESQ